MGNIANYKTQKEGQVNLPTESQKTTDTLPKKKVK